jgi:hypothetical protein
LRPLGRAAHDGVAPRRHAAARLLAASCDGSRGQALARSALWIGALAALLFVWVACEGPIDTKPAYLASECLDCGEASQALCRDGLDNDEDGLTDCDDPNCAVAYACLARGPENVAERCADGLDNDGNGFTDCGDFGCRSTTACRTPVQVAENSPTACADGLDDDWDGKIDCEDSDCVNAESVLSCEGSNARCDDGIDNDGNGFTDCADFSCSRADSVTVCN